MNGTFGITYEQLQPKLFLSAGPSATKHGPNTNHVYKISKALYGLKQAPRAWYECLRDFLIANGFKVGRPILHSLPKHLKMICSYAKFMLMILYLGLLTNLHVKSLVGS